MTCRYVCMSAFQRTGWYWEEAMEVLDIIRLLIRRPFVVCMWFTFWQWHIELLRDNLICIRVCDYLCVRTCVYVCVHNDFSLMSRHLCDNYLLLYQFDLRTTKIEVIIIISRHIFVHNLQLSEPYVSMHAKIGLIWFSRFPKWYFLIDSFY